MEKKKKNGVQGNSCSTELPYITDKEWKGKYQFLVSFYKHIYFDSLFEIEECQMLVVTCDKKPQKRTCHLFLIAIPTSLHRCGGRVCSLFILYNHLMVFIRIKYYVPVVLRN